MTCRGSNAEESPDRKGHPAVESTGGGNFGLGVTEKYRLPCEGKGENVR